MPEYLWEKLTRLASLSGLRLLRFQPLQENNTNCIVFDKPAYVFFFKFVPPYFVFERIVFERTSITGKN